MNKINNTPWHKDAIIYQIFLGAYKDSNGDGYGDIQGLIEKLDYLSWLGVDAIYLNPIFKANKETDFTRLHLGYEVLDFFAIDPDYGTFDDFKQLVQELHKRNIRIILDFITAGFHFNHPLFQSVIQDNSEYKECFIFKNSIPDEHWCNYGGTAWNLLPNGQYYYALFGTMPYFNLKSQLAQNYLLRVADFWLKLGVDGFRVDSAKNIITHGPGQQCYQHGSEEFFQKLENCAKKYGNDKLLILEMIPISLTKSFIAPNQNRAYWHDDHFYLPFGGINAKGQVCKDFSFLCADYFSYFIKKETEHSINVLSHHDVGRSIHRLPSIQQKISFKKLLAQFLLLRNGICQLYYGDEIGLLGIAEKTPRLRDDFSLNHVTSMAWNTETYGGFSTTTPEVPISADYLLHNVASELQNPHSLLLHYKKLIQLRKQYPVISQGKKVSLPFENQNIFSYLIINQENVALVAHNLSETQQNFSFNLASICLPSHFEIIYGSQESHYQVDDQLLFGEINANASICFYFQSSPTFQAWLDQEYSYLFPKDQKHHIILNDKQKSTSAIYFPSQLPNYIFCKHPTHWVKHKVSQNMFYLDNITQEIYLSDEVDYKIITAEWEKRFKQTHNLCESPGNRSLKALHTGEDADWYYFKIALPQAILAPENGGIDLIILISAPESDGANCLGFWGLPLIQLQYNVQYLIVFSLEKGVPLLYDIRKGVQPGIALSDIAFHHDNGCFYFIINKKALNIEPKLVSAFSWSAGHLHGAAKNLPAGIAEKLPATLPNQELEWATWK